MNEQKDVICKVSKSGKNLFARIPDEDRDQISKGALVKIVLLEKPVPDMDKLKIELKEFLKNPIGGEKLKGTMMGYQIRIPLARLINDLPKNKLEKIFLESLTNE